MAGKLIANLIVMGSGIIGRAMLQAYRKALENANKTGVAHEAINNIRRSSKAMTEQEARQVLGVTEQSTWEEIAQRYDTLFERNAKSGELLPPIEGSPGQGVPRKRVPKQQGRWNSNLKFAS